MQIFVQNKNSVHYHRTPFTHTRRHADVCTTYAHRNGLPRFVERPFCLVSVNISSGTISVLLREERIISECSPVTGYSPKCPQEIMFYPNYLCWKLKCISVLIIHCRAIKHDQRCSVNKWQKHRQRGVIWTRQATWEFSCKLITIIRLAADVRPCHWTCLHHLSFHSTWL